MRIGWKALIAVSALVAVAVLGCAGGQNQGQEPGVARAEDGNPDLNGIWQAVTTANWDIETHQAEAGPHPEVMGAWGAQPGGMGIVEGGTIPYTPEALADETGEPQEPDGRNAHQRPDAALTPAIRSSSVTGRVCRARTTCRFPFRSFRIASRS